MAVVVLLVCFGVKYGLDVYTHHGEDITVPDLQKMDYKKACDLMAQRGLQIVVNDSGYNKRLPADCVLAQTPRPGLKVKTGHVIYVTVNSALSPAFAIPDVIDNSSVREATAKLMSMGFKLLDPEYVTGEKDWVYGITCRGRRVHAGDIVSVETPIRLVVGSGTFEDDYEDADFVTADEQFVADSEMDDFQEVTAPPAEEEQP